MRICFLVGSMAISGGTYVIIQHATYLRRRGHAVTLAVMDPITPDMITWHDETILLDCVPFAVARKRRYDLVIATWWKTALEISSFNAPCFGYFVQSIESRFYPHHETALRQLVDHTYELPLAYVTEARWIAAHLATHYCHNASLVRNGVRKDIYNSTGNTCDGENAHAGLRILVEGPFAVPFKNTAIAIKLAKRAAVGPLWLLTSSSLSWVPGVDRVFSKVRNTNTASIYRSCDVLVKLSTVEGMFGPPLEMFHCGGTAVVFDVTGCDEYIKHATNALVVKTGDTQGVIDALRALASDRNFLESLKRGALTTAAAWPSWEESSQQFERWISETAIHANADVRSIREHSANALREYCEYNAAVPSRSRAMACVAHIRSLASGLPPRVKQACRQAAMIWESISPNLRVR